MEYKLKVLGVLFRNKKNMRWLAEQLGITPAYLSDILNENRKAFEVRRRIDVVLNNIELKEEENERFN